MQLPCQLMPESILLRNGSQRKTSSQVTISFLKNTNWPCQDNYCRLGDTDFLWQVRWKTYWFWGEYRKEKSLLCWMRSLRLFLRQIFLIQRSWSWGNTFALNLEENYILLRMCFVSEPQSTTVLKSFLKPIVLFSLYIIILSTYQPSDSVIQYPFIEHLYFL